KLLDFGFHLARPAVVILILVGRSAWAQWNHRVIGSKGSGLAPLDRRTLVPGPGPQHRAQPEQYENRHSDHNESGQIEELVHGLVHLTDRARQKTTRQRSLSREFSLYIAMPQFKTSSPRGKLRFRRRIRGRIP